MYEAFFGLNCLPFQLNPKKEFFFGSKGHQRAVSYLEYGVNKGEGFIAITGEVGAGKTTLIGHLLEQLDNEKVVPVKLVTSQFNADSMLQMIASGLGLRFQSDQKSQIMIAIEEFLHRCAEGGKRVLLIIDEAQNIPQDALEELRMISNYQIDGQSLFQIFLLGQPEFRQILNAADMSQLRQRIVAWHHLGPLSRDEIQGYVEYRLEIAGWMGGGLIADDAYDIIYQYSGGIPRKINTFCDRLLLFSFLEEQLLITWPMANEVLHEINSEGMMPNPPLNSEQLQTLIDENTELMDHQVGSESDRLQQKPTKPSNSGILFADAEVEAGGVLWLTNSSLERLLSSVLLSGMDSDALKSLSQHLVEIQYLEQQVDHDFIQGVDIDEAEISLFIEPGSMQDRWLVLNDQLDQLFRKTAPKSIILFNGSDAAVIAAQLASRISGCQIIHIHTGGDRGANHSRLSNNCAIINLLADQIILPEPQTLEALTMLRAGEQRQPHLMKGEALAALVAHYRRSHVDPSVTLGKYGAASVMGSSNKFGFWIMDNRREDEIPNKAWKALVMSIRVIQKSIPMFISMNRVIQEHLDSLNLKAPLISQKGVLLPTLNYLEISGLVEMAEFVLTDSSFIREQAHSLGIPTVFFDPDLEIPIQDRGGLNHHVGPKSMNIVTAVFDVLGNEEGRAAMRAAIDTETQDQTLTTICRDLEMALTL